jgi:hypothetical protein
LSTYYARFSRREIADWLKANGFRVLAPLTFPWINDEGFVFSDRFLFGETPESLAEVLKMLRRHKRGLAKKK